MVHLKINGIPAEVPEGSNIIDAARSVGVNIPSLCYLKGINEIGACRICVVEIKGGRGLVAACAYPVSEGLEVFTDTPKVRASRKTTLELILSNHRKKCLSCDRNLNCELQRLAYEYGVDEDRFLGDTKEACLDASSPYIVRDNSKCVMCRRCTAVCSKVQSVSVIGLISRGFAAHVGCAFDKKLDNAPCVGCGQCVVSCPVGALTEKSSIDKVKEALQDENKKVVFFTAPAVRTSIGEPFGLPMGTNSQGKMVSSIRRLGADKVFNMDVTADLTILEESTELIERIKENKPLPMFTSCCPGWVKFCEHYYPELLPQVSSCKSPQEMFGAVLKSYYCSKNNINPKELFVVSVIPCTAKKFEVTREELRSADYDDVDAAITTRELARMIKSAGIDFDGLEDESFDDPFETASGAGTIFGASGGVMEAALRTAACKLGGTGEVIDFKEVRGMEGIKEASYTLGGSKINVAVASGLANARKVIEMVRSGEKDYSFIEIMACPGGCVNGGGQPIPSDELINYSDVREKRAAVLYDADMGAEFRASHESPVIKTLYDEYFGAPCEEKAHKLLHTTYIARQKH